MSRSQPLGDQHANGDLQFALTDTGRSRSRIAPGRREEGKFFFYLNRAKRTRAEKIKIGNARKEKKKNGLCVHSFSTWASPELTLTATVPPPYRQHSRNQPTWKDGDCPSSMRPRLLTMVCARARGAKRRLDSTLQGAFFTAFPFPYPQTPGALQKVQPCSFGTGPGTASTRGREGEEFIVESPSVVAPLPTDLRLPTSPDGSDGCSQHVPYSVPHEMLRGPSPYISLGSRGTRGVLSVVVPDRTCYHLCCIARGWQTARPIWEKPSLSLSLPPSEICSLRCTE